MARSRPRTPATKPPKAIAWRAEYTRRLVTLHKAFSEHVIDYAQRTLGTTRADAKREVPHEAIFGTAEFRPRSVKVRRIHEIGGLNRAQFLKDPESYRPSSFESVRGAAPENLPPVEVEVLADGGVILRDGRHRLAVAIERGQETIRAHVVQRDAQYNVIASYVGDVPTGAIKVTDPPRAPAAGGSIADELQAQFGDLIESLGLSKFLRRMGHSITKQQANYLKRVANVPVSGVAPAAKLEAWRQQNLSLIRSLGQDQIQQVGDILRPAQNQGLRWEDVADEIQTRLGVGESRARLIARDQTNKWNGAMQQQTQTDAGIASYKWVTANDQAVRGRPGGVYAKSKENHWDLQGTIHRWDAPPTIPGTDVQSHPGGRIQCRCQAVPIVPWLDDA
jgi:SPP1 gp7 family putative phage head morphogenesis protein